MKFFSLPHKEFEIPGKAECLKMCSEEEVQFRSEIAVFPSFEKSDRGDHFDLLAIKKYERSVADALMTAKYIRPP